MKTVEQINRELTNKIFNLNKKILNLSILRYNWSAAIDITVDHEKKEIHFNGFSENDLY